MTPYYATAAAQAAFIAEACSWLGTPFRHGTASVKGSYGGVDCVGLCIAVHVECGACEPFTCERLPLDWHHHHDRSAIMDFLHQPSVRERLLIVHPEDGLLNGDMVAIQTDKCVHHLGLYLHDGVGSHLLHVPIGACVQRWALGVAPLRGKIKSAWRIMGGRS